MSRPRRILRRFRMDEISAVDRPAQQGAKVVLMKRQEPEPVSELASLIAKQELTGARSFTSMLNEQEERRRQWQAEERLWPLFSTLQESIGTIASDESLSNESRLSRVEENVEQFLAAVRAEWPGVEQELQKLYTEESAMPTIEELQAQITALTKRAEESEAAVTVEKQARETAERIAKLNDDERQHLDKIKDEDERGKFLAMSAEERKKVMSKREQDDEIVKVSGQEIRKSEVGASVFAVLKAQDAALQEQAAALHKEREERRQTELAKRAETELAHIPGTVEDRVAMLKALDGLDESVAKSFTELLNAHERLAGTAFSSIGTRQPAPMNKSGGAFMTRVAEIRKRDDVPEHVAMTRARQEFPREFEEFQGLTDDG